MPLLQRSTTFATLLAPQPIANESGPLSPVNPCGSQFYLFRIASLVICSGTWGASATTPTALSAGPPPTPPSLLHPKAVYLFNIVIPILGSLIIFRSILDSVITRRLTWGLLFQLNSLLVYWQETLGDWGQHLIYSPLFRSHSLLAWLPLKTPTDPIFMPFAYAVYWTVHSILLLQLAHFVARRRQGWTVLKAVLLLGIPVNYVWDIAVEATAAAMGWWTYDPGFGPVIVFPNGGRQPLLWPVLLMSGWPNAVAYWAGKPPLHGLNLIERWFGLGRWTEPKEVGVVPEEDFEDEDEEEEPLVRGRGRTGYGSTAVVVREGKSLSLRQRHDAALDYRVLEPRWRFELRRFGAWFVVFQVSFFVMLVVPLVALRILTGHNSEYVP